MSALICFHCGAPVPKESEHISIQINGAAQPMCCVSCRESAKWIHDIGLSDFYQLRAHQKVNTDAVVQTDHQIWQRPELQRHVLRKVDDTLSEVQLLIDGVRCNGCVLFLERVILQSSGVQQIHINALTRRARVVFNESVISLTDLLVLFSKAGYNPRPLDSASLNNSRKDESRDLLKRLLVAGFGMMQAMMFALVIYLGPSDEINGPTLEFFRWLGFLVTSPVVLYSAQPFFKSALRGLRGRELNMDVPISIAVALIYGASLFQAAQGGAEVYFDSVSMLVFFLLTGRYLEMRVRHRAMDSTDALARLTPAWAERRDANGHYEKVSVHELQRDDVVRVKEGGHVPADGLLVSDVAQLDEALLSGEAATQHKQRGDKLIAGSVVLRSPIELCVTHCGADTFLATLANLATRAQAMRPRLAQAGQAAATRFVIRVLSLTVITTITWLIIQPDRALEATLAVLVVSCPCAFALAVPAAITRTISVLAPRGVLIVQPDAIEVLATFDRAVFDKTGTLTVPSMSVKSTQENLSHDDALQFAASLAQASSHPLSKALIDANSKPLHHTDSIDVEIGNGIQGVINGDFFKLGRTEFALEISDSVMADQIASEDTVLSRNGNLIATFKTDEALRYDAANAVLALQTQNIQCEIQSGDSKTRVKRIADTLNITEWQGRQLPTDKLAHITAMQDAGRRVLVVGDGSNDAPVLAGADISVALASGTELAQAQADVVLCGGQLTGLIDARYTARQAMRILKQNQRWALCYNLLAMPLAALGFVPPWLAAIGMSTSSLIVILNAMRIGHQHSDNAAQQSPVPL